MENWPLTAPEDESPEIAALRREFTRETPDATLVALVQSGIKLSHTQGFEGGRVTLAGPALHAGLFVEACSVLRLKDTSQQDIDDARAAIIAARDAQAARDVLLKRLPPEMAEKLQAEAGAFAEVARLEVK